MELTARDVKILRQLIDNGFSFQEDEKYLYAPNQGGFIREAYNREQAENIPGPKELVQHHKAKLPEMEAELKKAGITERQLEYVKKRIELLDKHTTWKSLWGKRGYSGWHL
jgi:DNA-binding transcriptional MerR regulator